MNRVITISREFGSGGREFARRLADSLNIAYYDREIISELAKRTNLTEEYIHKLGEHSPAPLFPITIGHTMSPVTSGLWEQQNALFIEQANLLKELAQKSDCIIVGRCADYCLKEFNPLKIRIYAELDSRIARCKSRAPQGEALSDREYKQRINDIDKNRAKYYQFYTGNKWSDPLNYDLCINTTDKDIKQLAAYFAEIFSK
ncbi:MAG: cytidylate kinase-like family protein [Clostridia bacterium]|nr:cytidylate kinase-like family protein [Clostridia bacterium]